MKHTRSLLALALAILFALAGCQGSGSQATPAPADVPGDTPGGVVSATGKVVPVRYASLSFAVPGVVKEVLVKEGDQVTTGQILARLDAPELEAAVAQAEAALKAAQAQRALLLAGARAVDVESARKAVETAQEGVHTAEEAAKVAQANVAVAEAGVSAAQALLMQAKAGPTADELELARQQVELAKGERLGAQGQRDAMGGLRNRASGGDPVAQAMYQAGGYESAQGHVLAAETNVTIAELSLKILAAGARSEAIAAAQASVKQAQAGVTVTQAQAAAARQQVTVSQRQLAQAQAALEQVEAPARSEELQAQEAAVAQAEAALKAAQAALRKTVLIAPLAGTISQLELRAGEFAMVGDPQVALGDLATFRIETTDLDEVDVARIAEGRGVALTFDALPGVKLRGTVERIALRAGTGGGGTTYKATITLNEAEPRLRWGMTAFADIKTE